MLKVDQLRELIIKPALIDLIMFTEEAMALLVFTCAVESLGGTYLKQIKGPALGIYQMEPENYNDIWQNYIKKQNSLMLLLLSNFGIVNMPSEDRMIYDLRYATAMVRLHYARFSDKIPPANDVDGIWNYYKTYYNTKNGSAIKYDSIAKYQTFIKS